MTVTCQYCGRPAVLMTQTEWYGREYDGRRMWCCRDCDASVGTHPDGSPLGSLANAQLKLLRIKAHSLIDPLWKTGKYKRGDVYSMVNEMTGVRHIGQSDEDECKKVIYAMTHKYQP